MKIMETWMLPLLFAVSDKANIVQIFLWETDLSFLGLREKAGLYPHLE